MKIKSTPFTMAKQQYRTSIPGEKAQFIQPLYDYQTYAAAGQTSLQFFQVQMGQSGKTFADTNMTLAGQLPRGQEFLCVGIEVDFTPGVNNAPAADVAKPGTTFRQYANDVAAALNGGYLELNILDKNWLRDAPLRKFPPTRRLAGNAALAVSLTDAATSNTDSITFAQSVGATYEITPLWLTSSTSFSVELKWPTAVALPSGTAGRIGVTLLGTLYRDVQ